jgi:hypothetical protein
VSNIPEFSVEGGGAGLTLKDGPGQLLNCGTQTLGCPLGCLGSGELGLALKPVEIELLKGSIMLG